MSLLDIKLSPDHYQKLIDLRHSEDVKFLFSILTREKEKLEDSLLREARKPLPDKDRIMALAIRIENLEATVTLPQRSYDKSVKQRD
jgi:hypothetical protein